MAPAIGGAGGGALRGRSSGETPWLPWRRGIARVLYSPAGRFRSTVFEPGETKRVGRDERAGWRIADPSLRGAHFEIYFDGLRFHVESLSEAPDLAVDGRPARFGEIHNGGFVVAGATTIRLFVERTTPPVEDDEDAPGGPTRTPEAARAQVDQVLASLGPARERGTLYGVFDAARDPRIRILLDEGIDEHASLYEGDAGAALDDVAPYLVRFAPSSQLLDRVVTEGWGRAWGIFARASIGAKDVRRHFRRFLMVRDEGTNERMYFRFYDPRVFREFHKVATPRQRDELLGGLAEITLESAEGALLQFASTSAAHAAAEPLEHESLGAEPGGAT